MKINKQQIFGYVLGIVSIFCAGIAHAKDAVIESEFSDFRIVLNDKKDRDAYNVLKGFRDAKNYVYIVARTVKPNSVWYGFRTFKTESGKPAWVGDYGLEVPNNSKPNQWVPYLLNRQFSKYQRAFPTPIFVSKRDGTGTKGIPAQKPIDYPMFDWIASNLLARGYSLYLDNSGNNADVYAGDAFSGSVIFDAKSMVIPAEALSSSIGSKGVKAAIIQWTAFSSDVAGIAYVYSNKREWFPFSAQYRQLFDASGFPIPGKGLTEAVYRDYYIQQMKINYQKWQYYMASMNMVIANMRF